jgi:hypothetical protein
MNCYISLNTLNELITSQKIYLDLFTVKEGPAFSAGNKYIIGRIFWRAAWLDFCGQSVYKTNFRVVRNKLLK